jgi:hypothetical protein
VTCGTCKRRGWDKARNCAGDPSSRRIVWGSGEEGPDGKPRVWTTVCPVRQIDPEIGAVVDWFLRSQSYDGLSTVPSARIEWPHPGGLSQQNPRLVSAFDLMRFEMPKVPLPKRKRTEGGPIANPRRRRRQRRE